MLKVEIDSTSLNERKGISSKTQRPYHLRMQTAYLHIVDQDGKPAKYPEKFELMLDADQAAYPVGFYLLHPSAISVDDGRLAVSPRLVPAPAASKA
jgi:hypothetical protein